MEKPGRGQQPGRAGGVDRGAHVETAKAVRSTEELPRGPSAGRSPPRYHAAQLPVVSPDAYAIEGEVAHGGNGRILRAWSTHLRRPVAIKELLAGGEAAEARFVREAMITARLRHPSIVAVHEAGRWPTGEPFYAMQLVSGRSLAEVIDDPALAHDSGSRRAPHASAAARERARTRGAGPAPFAARLALLPHVIAVADAMAYAHSERIVHRDLKPANVLVGRFGETVVIDWGLAKEIGPGVPEPEEEPHRAGRAEGVGASGDEGLTVAGAVMGTPAYTAPEQAEGHPVDERADVYALGALLYHVLSGSPPYEAGHAQGVVRAVVAGPPRALSERAPEVPVELATIVGRSMARAPADRYASARDLADDLHRYATGQLVGAHRYTRAELVRRFARRYRAILSVALAALGVVAITGALAVRRVVLERDRAAEKEAEATRRADDLTLFEARAAAASHPKRALSLLATLSPSFAGWSAARVIGADACSAGVAFTLEGHAAGISNVAFSADGKTLASASDDRTARLWDLATGRSTVLSGHTDEVWAASFLRGGALVATASKDTTIRLWDVPTGALVGVLVGHARPVSALAALDRRRAVISADDGGTVRLWDVDTRSSHVVSEAGGTIVELLVTADERHVVWLSQAGPLEIWDSETDTRRRLADIGPNQEAARLPRAATFVAVRSLDGRQAAYDLGGQGSRPLPTRDDEVPLALSPDGRSFAFSSPRARLILTDVVTGAERTLDNRSGNVLGAVFSPDSARLAVRTVDHDVQLWDLARGQPRVLRGFDDIVNTAVFSPDGRLLAAADRTVQVFQVEERRSMGEGAALIKKAALSVEGAVLASGDAAGVIRLWDPARLTAPLAEIDGHMGEIQALAFSADGAVLASAGDEAIRLWDQHGIALGSVAIGATEIKALAFSPRGRRLAWAGDHGELGVLDLGTGEPAPHRTHDARYFAGGETVHALAFSPDGETLASGGSDRVVRLWSLASGEATELLGHADTVTALRFSRDGRMLVSGSLDHTLRLWDLATASARVVDVGGGGVVQLAFSRDGAALYTLSGRESGVRAWDPSTGRLLHAHLGHHGVVQSFALSPDGGRLVMAGDREARLLDLASGENRALHDVTGPASWAAFSADGAVVYLLDGAVRAFPDDLPIDGAALRKALASGCRASP